MAETAPWITYRPELKVLDCTIRDGGLINNHQFTEELVRAVYETCVAAGIDYMEVGYKASPRQHSRSDFGPWKFCDEDLLNRVFADHDAERTGLKLTVMADAGKCDWHEQIVPRQESKLDMIRVAFYAHQVSEARGDDRALPRAGLRDVRQPDGDFEHHGSGDRHGAGRGRKDAGGRDGDRR